MIKSVSDTCQQLIFIYFSFKNNYVEYKEILFTYTHIWLKNCALVHHKVH